MFIKGFTYLHRKSVAKLHNLHRKRIDVSFAIALLVIFALLSGCASDPPQLTPISEKSYQFSYKHKRAYNRPYRVKGKMYYPLTSPSGYSEIGIASWYGAESGTKTSMGIRFRPEGISAAHKTLPLPSRVRVTNLNNGRSIVLVVNDRGPFKNDRIIDLSHGAARKIGLQGLARVKIDYLGSID
jgi:rare lipoprotein A